MDENESDLDQGAEQDDAAAPKGKKKTSLWWKFRWLLFRAAALMGAFVVFLVLITAGSAWYTSRPEFCRSCHIMEPYYVSWENSSHSDVSCVKCHFPPGVGEKIRGKMLGLVQLAKYVTHSEGPRPAAEIPDASCLRSGCHETQTLTGRIDFHGVPFDHSHHLEGLRRGKKLRCTSCHGQIVQGEHMTVTKSTCFLCHFKEGLFNEGLGACTRCHQIPEEDFDLGGGVMFNHELAYDRGVDCAYCHGDLIRGDGAVPPERCGVCHNRQGDLAKREDHEFMHRIHVTDHKVDCLDCHLAIHHSLDHDKIAHAAADCSACHPDHHREQADMLRGQGAKMVPSDSSMMVAARLACSACHRRRTVSSTGSVLWEASTATCAECHDRALSGRLRTHYDRLLASLSDLRAAVPDVREAVAEAKLDFDRDEDRLAAISARLDDVAADLDFLEVANGIHNVHYATTLTRAVLEELTSICVELELSRPTITIPQWIE